MAITGSVISALQIIVGVATFQRSPKDTVRLQQMVQAVPHNFQTEEVPRMQSVIRSFKRYLGMNIVFWLLSAGVNPVIVFASAMIASPE